MLEQKLAGLFACWCGVAPTSIEKLPGSGSSRMYFRLSAGTVSAIGVWNDDIRENKAFTAFSHQFFSNGLPVPEVLIVSRDLRAYLQSDLGDVTLYLLLSQMRGENQEFPDQIRELYKTVLNWLPEFQITAGKGIDYSKSYPRQSFDRQSMMWDLNYFKYYFLKLSGIPFDEQGLEDDFRKFCDLLMTAGPDYFLYRDFQSRNVMIYENKPYF
jgi:aminoglycoside/choline kinase family phosphotransferase